MTPELFVKAVKAGAFDEAQKQMSNFSDQKIRDTLHGLAYDDSDICSYAFALFLLLKENSIRLHDFAFLIADMGINYLPGAYAAAAYHARAVYEFSRQDDPANDGGLLSLFHYPETPIRAEEAVFVAKQVLEHNPTYWLALEALKDAVERKEDPLVAPCNDCEQLEQYIVAGKFIKAKELLSAVSTRELYSMILYLGCEERNLCAYAFTWYLMQEKEQAELHYLAYRIVTLAYARNMNGCDATGLFHIKRAMALEPENEKYVECFLMLHTPPMEPTKLISDDEVVAVATSALERDNCNVVAIKTLRKLGRLDPKYELDDGLRIPAE